MLFFGLALSGLFDFGLRVSGLLDELFFTAGDPRELEFDLVGLLYLAELLDLPRPPPPPPPLGISLCLSIIFLDIINFCIKSFTTWSIYKYTKHKASIRKSK